MKNIAITANTSWYIYNFRKNTILELLRSGYNVFVIAPYDDYSTKLINLGCEYNNIFIDRYGTNIFNDIRTTIDFYLIFRKIKVKVVLNFTNKNNIYSTIAAYLNKSKIVNNISGMGISFTKKTLTYFILKYLYKFSQPLADVIFFQNNEDKIYFKRNNIAKNVDQILIPGSGVDLKRFKFATKKNINKLNFLLASRLLKEKGIYFYYEAARYFKKKYAEKVEFNLIGFIDKQNPSSIRLEEIRLWEKSKIINYLGSSDSIELIMKNMDCIVLPSYYSEGTPKSLLEAAASGKPIITTDNVGCRNVVDEGVNGYLVQPQSLDSLIEGINKFIGLSKKEKLKMGMNSRKKAIKDFDEQNIINKYLFIINNYFV